uniref:NAC domain-containing protein n=1 Tax=Tanacetum cinerariifolium TaxID=118510 RepID=A0A6L2L5G6_TANCI|nr:NAC domain-containing protein [Tanacetum cinerariifolium]
MCVSRRFINALTWPCGACLVADQAGRENNRILEEILRTLEANSPVDVKEHDGSDDYMEVTYDKEQCLSDHYTAPDIPLAYTPPIPFLVTMKPAYTLLMGDEESEVTSDSDLECDMPATTPLPTTDVKEENLDINLPLGEHLDTLSMGDREIDFDPIRDIKELERLLADDPVPVPRVFDEPLGNSDSISRSFDVTYSNPLINFDDNFTLRIGNKIFDDNFETLCSLDPLKATPLLDESILLVTPLFDVKHICIREVERFDPFFSLT